jgi:hypothetical protein
MLAIALVTPAIRSAPQGQTLLSPSKLDLGPLTDYKAALPNSQDVLRFRRGERHSTPNSPVSELREDSDPILIATDTGDPHRNTTPFEESDAVVVGGITNGQAYLSNDKRDIYSEFKVKVKDIVKTSAQPYLREGDTIDVQRHGGAVRLSSGKIVMCGSKDYSMPQIGKRYLLFLKYDPSTEDFRLLTGYQLEGSCVYELDDLQHGAEQSHPNELFHPLREHGETEEQFLSPVKSARPAKAGGN